MFSSYHQCRICGGDQVFAFQIHTNNCTRFLGDFVITWTENVGTRYTKTSIFFVNISALLDCWLCVLSDRNYGMHPLIV